MNLWEALNKPAMLRTAWDDFVILVWAGTIMAALWVVFALFVTWRKK